MSSSNETLMVVGEADKLPRLSTQMERMKRIGSCQFCSTKVVVNRNNYNEQVNKGKKPVLCCVTCYTNGTYIRQGYKG